ncbi:ABC transporter ATP-binding protein [Lactobacillus delbrueckii subsp. bulgaricus]|nr:ABC transporter ATP-binding protein [Lactobacillus delbrueckii subsp. bulgaricus]MBT8930954.1 ABC transporter ATP-binding protein [Lactobacillus delbrueckii subsp. bulgaricus]
MGMRYEKLHGGVRGQNRTLALLSKNEGMKQAELARFARVRPSSISEVVDRLERHGLIERRRDNSAISLGNVQAFLQYSNQFSQPLTQLANMSSTIQQTIASAERIFAVLDAEDMDETVHPAEGLKTDTKLTFKDVSFSYTDAPLIENFSLEVPKGEMVAIVGPTGAGKTTIINLLERFYDVKGGQIYLDGQETRSMSREDLRSHIAMVLQDTWLFTGTIFANIKYGREDAGDEEVYRAQDRQLHPPAAGWLRDPVKRRRDKYFPGAKAALDDCPGLFS